VAAGDLLALDDLSQPVGVAVRFGRCDREPGAEQQWPEELPDGDIERVGRLLQDQVVGREAVLLLHPAEPVDDRPVLDHDALGLAGRAGGVDDVGQLLGVLVDW
jgi:hypothetical protein